MTTSPAPLGPTQARPPHPRKATNMIHTTTGKPQTTADEIYAAMAAYHEGRGHLGDRYHVLSAANIADLLIGEATYGQTTWGGSSRETEINKHLSFSALKRTIREMVDQGRLVDIDGFTAKKHAGLSARGVQDRATVYVTIEAWRAAEEHRDRVRQSRQRASALKAAQDEVLQRHQEEVLAAYREACAAAGIEPGNGEA